MSKKGNYRSQLDSSINAILKCDDQMLKLKDKFEKYYDVVKATGKKDKELSKLKDDFIKYSEKRIVVTENFKSAMFSVILSGDLEEYDEISAGKNIC